MLASGWELFRFHTGCPVWRRDTPGGMAFVMHDHQGWFPVVGTIEHSTRQYATRQEACKAADAVPDGAVVSL